MVDALSYLEKLNEIKQHGKLPRHVAIIMDGNGRWAQNRNLPRVVGHNKGVESVREVVSIAGELGLKALTLFAFSDENWGRPKLEVAAILKLLDTFIVKERSQLHEQNVRLRTIGDIKRLPVKSQRLIEETIAFLSGNTGLELNIALSYGSKSEIVSACKEIALKVQSESLSIEDINDETFAAHLQTFGTCDPDLVIRTSGEQRLSNFLLWQLAYAEIYFTKVLWPDFKKNHFLDAMWSFQSRDRRFGLTQEQIESKNSAFDSTNIVSQ